MYGYKKARTFGWTLYKNCINLLYSVLKHKHLELCALCSYTGQFAKWLLSKLQIGLKGEFSKIYSPENQGCAKWSSMQNDDTQTPFTWFKVSFFNYF